MSSQLSVLSKLCIMNTLLHFLLLFQFFRSLRNMSLGDFILGKSHVIITVGWLWWRHQRAPLFSLASGSPNPLPTTFCRPFVHYACLRSCSATVHFIQNHCLYIVCQGRKQGWWVGLTPPLVWHVTESLLPAKRRLIVSAYLLLVNLSISCKNCSCKCSDIVMSVFYSPVWTLSLKVLQLWTAVS